MAALAVRGWLLRLLAVLVARSPAPGWAIWRIGLWVIRDVAVRGRRPRRGAGRRLVGTQRHYWGAVLTLVAAVCTLAGAVLLMRAAGARRGATTAKYVGTGGAARGGAADSCRGGDDVRTDDLGRPRRGPRSRPIPDNEGR